MHWLHRLYANWRFLRVTQRWLADACARNATRNLVAINIRAYAELELHRWFRVTGGRGHNRGFQSFFAGCRPSRYNGSTYTVSVNVCFHISLKHGQLNMVPGKLGPRQLGPVAETLQLKCIPQMLAVFIQYEYIQGVFFHWYPPKKLKYGKPRLGESTLT